MSRTQRSRSLLLVVMLAVAGLFVSGCGFSVYSLPLPGGADTGSNPMTVKVQFADALDLVPQSTVKLDDVTVGKVTKIQLKDGVAEVTMSLRKDTRLASNATAKIQQTSLLGEKFVELDQPMADASPTLLKSGDLIPLARTGDNPEVEEVLGALSLILNGGGIAQLKTISTELNKALGGREDSARSVLTEVNTLVTNLDDNKQSIVNAIEALNRLSKSVHAQEGTIDQTLDELPSALTSINAQRKDLVTMLQALSKLGNTGVRVINASKQSTISVVRNLQPVLTRLADTGDTFTRNLNLFLTFPFVDATVGETPQIARNLHMGDYINLDVTVDLSLDALNNLPDIPQTVCMTIKQLEKQNGGPLSAAQLLQLDVSKLCDSATAKSLSQCQHDLEKNLSHNPPILTPPASCTSLPSSLLSDLTSVLQNPTSTLCTLVTALCPKSSSTKSPGSTTPPTSPLCTLPLLSLCRAAPGFARDPRRPVSMRQLTKTFDPGLVSLMVPELDTDATSSVTANGGPR